VPDELYSGNPIDYGCLFADFVLQTACSYEDRIGT
jgi:hypothetical protein